MHWLSQWFGGKFGCLHCCSSFRGSSSIWGASAWSAVKMASQLPKLHSIPKNDPWNSILICQTQIFCKKKWLEKLNPARNRGSNILLPPICSCHRLLCSMTNTSEKYERTQQGNLLMCLMPKTLWLTLWGHFKYPNFYHFYPYSAIFGNSWGQNRALLWVIKRVQLDLS